MTVSPVSTLPALRTRPERASIRSVTVVLPASTCAKIPMLRRERRRMLFGLLLILLWLLLVLLPLLFILILILILVDVVVVAVAAADDVDVDNVHLEFQTCC